MQKKNVPYGSDMSAGTYKCDDCGYIYSNQSKTSLPPYPQAKAKPHVQHSWTILSGVGDDSREPYPDR